MTTPQDIKKASDKIRYIATRASDYHDYIYRVGRDSEIKKLLPNTRARKLLINKHSSELI